MTRRFAGLAAVVGLCAGLPAGSARTVRAAAAAPGAGVAPRTPQAGPRRIVSIVPAVTEMLYAIGDGAAVVAVSSFDHYPPAVNALPRVGALVDPDVERILSLRPDLVIVYGTQSDLIAHLDRVHIPVFRYVDAGLADIPAAIEQLGVRVGLTDAGRREAASIRDGLDAVRRSVAGRPRPKTALIFGREPGSLRGMFASGGVGFMHDLLVTAGGADVFGDIARKSLQVTTELLLTRQPEVILEVYPADGWTPERIATERRVWQALPSLPAVRSNRVDILANDALVIPGPRVVEAARLMQTAIHGHIGNLESGIWNRYP